jgi:hypothetical protein
MEQYLGETWNILYCDNLDFSFLDNSKAYSAGMKTNQMKFVWAEIIIHYLSSRNFLELFWKNTK